MEIFTNLIYINPNSGGAYSGLQSGQFNNIPNGMAVWPEELNTENFYQYNGFVTLTIENIDDIPTVISYEPNIKAWEVWKASQSENINEIIPPTMEERLSAMEQAILTIMMEE